MSRLGQAAPARKEALPAKVALTGPTGAGKTYSALLAAEVFAGEKGRILVIDTERRSASLYADLAQFDAVDWVPPYDPRELGATLLEAATKYEVVVIDSLSHFWMGEGGTLDIVDAAATKARGNSYVGWREGTPAQQSFYEALIAAPCHVICCLRSKMEHVLEEDSRGKKVPRKVGMAPVQRDDATYEFTVQMDLDFEHNAIVGKTRCSALADKVYPKGKTKEWARTLVDWLNDGAAPPSVACPADGCDRTARTKADHVPHLLADHGWTQDEQGKVHRPTETSQQGQSDDDAHAKGDGGAPGRLPSDGPRSHDAGGVASEPSPDTAGAGVSEGTSAPGRPSRSRPTSPPAHPGGPAEEVAATSLAAASRPPSEAQRRALMAASTAAYPDRDARLTWAGGVLGRRVDSFAALPAADAAALLAALDKSPAASPAGGTTAPGAVRPGHGPAPAPTLEEVGR